VIEVIDSQIHIWRVIPGEDVDRSEDLYNVFGSPEDAMTIERAIASMNAVGVHRAVLALPPIFRSMDYALEAIKRYPDRFVAVVRRLDHLSPDVDNKVRHIRDQAGVLALRVVFNRDEMLGNLRAGDYDRLWTAASAYGVPIMLHVSGHLPEVVPVAQRFPHLRLLIDHMGLHQPPSHTSPRPFEHLDHLLALSDYPNIAVKVSGVASLSREQYPFSDLWPHLHRVIAAFGIQRVAWGSDFTRLSRIVTYADSLSFVLHSTELADDDKDWILRKSIRALLDWPSDVRTSAKA